MTAPAHPYWIAPHVHCATCGLPMIPTQWRNRNHECIDCLEKRKELEEECEERLKRRGP